MKDCSLCSDCKNCRYIFKRPFLFTRGCYHYVVSCRCHLLLRRCHYTTCKHYIKGYKNANNSKV